MTLRTEKNFTGHLPIAGLIGACMDRQSPLRRSGQAASTCETTSRG